MPRWFEGVSLNFAENVLYSRDTDADAATGQQSTRWKEDGKVAITEIREGGRDVRHVLWGELRRRAGALAAASES